MTPTRILVVMPNWLGEALFATPFLRAVHEAWPNAFLAVLGVPRCQEVLAQNPHVHQFLVYDERGAHRTLRAKGAYIADLRSLKIDTAWVLRPSLTRTGMLALAKIPRRIGFANVKSGWLLTDRLQRSEIATHKADGYLRLLDPLGVTPKTHPYRYYPSDQERAKALTQLRAHGLLNGKPMIVLHPGANWPHKRWPPERFAELAVRLCGQQECAIIVTGSPEDAALAETIRARMRVPPVVLAGRMTFRDSAAILEQASLVVSNDTGMLHVAAALGRPIVALYGPTSPAITGPRGDPSRMRVLHHPDCCPEIPCYHPHHPQAPGMLSISVEEVQQAAEELLHACGGRTFSAPSNPTPQRPIVS